MGVIVVVGAQFGDEAKGKITDYLAGRARYVVRTGGGPNAGHSIHLAEGTVVLHQVPCGILRAGVTAVCGPGMVLDPKALEEELRTLEERHLLKGSFVISERAHAILPTHLAEDAWEEELRTATNPSAGLGTTRRGIGPAYADMYGRWGVSFGDLIRPAKLAARLELLYAAKPYLKNLPDRATVLADLSEVATRLAPYVRPTEPLLWSAVERHETILLEGAQGALLDINFGTYPYVTSGHSTSAGALVGSGLPPAEVTEVIGVTKAYATRVGAGPFPTEVGGDMAAYLQREGGERGATTGRLRQVGWLDLVLLRYVSKLNGFSSFALTKVDVLGRRPVRHSERRDAHGLPAGGRGGPGARRAGLREAPWVAQVLGAAHRTDPRGGRRGVALDPEAVHRLRRTRDPGPRRVGQLRAAARRHGLAGPDGDPPTRERDRAVGRMTVGP
jgi:adenylosuccinate synthase